MRPVAQKQPREPKQCDRRCEHVDIFPIKSRWTARQVDLTMTMAILRYYPSHFKDINVFVILGHVACDQPQRIQNVQQHTVFLALRGVLFTPFPCFPCLCSSTNSGLALHGHNIAAPILVRPGCEQLSSSPSARLDSREVPAAA
jgi:hypothetical protein